MTVEQNPIGQSHEPSTSETAQVVRASSAPTRAPGAGPTARHTSAIITAELPAYRPGPASGPATRSRYAAPRPHGRARRRDPAPLPVQLVVWLLAFVCLVALIALVTVRAHPTALSFLRKTSAASISTSAPPTSGTPSRSTTMTPVSNDHATKTVTYDVPASAFSIVVTPIATAYVTVRTPPSSKQEAYATVITKAKAEPLAVTESASVVIAAAASSIKIVSGSTVLGTVTAPVVGTNYIFNAKG